MGYKTKLLYFILLPKNFDCLSSKSLTNSAAAFIFIKIMFCTLYVIPLLWAECPVRIIGSSTWPLNFHSGWIYFASLLLSFHIVAFILVNLAYTGIGLQTAVIWFHWEGEIQRRYVFALTLYVPNFSTNGSAQI